MNAWDLEAERISLAYDDYVSQLLEDQYAAALEAQERDARRAEEDRRGVFGASRVRLPRKSFGKRKGSRR